MFIKYYLLAYLLFLQLVVAAPVTLSSKASTNKKTTSSAKSGLLAKSDQLTQNSVSSSSNKGATSNKGETDNTVISTSKGTSSRTGDTNAKVNSISNAHNTNTGTTGATSAHSSSLAHGSTSSIGNHKYLEVSLKHDQYIHKSFLQFGSLLQSISGIFDTGSTLTWVPGPSSMGQATKPSMVKMAKTLLTDVLYYAKNAILTKLNLDFPSASSLNDKLNKREFEYKRSKTFKRLAGSFSLLYAKDWMVGAYYKDTIKIGAATINQATFGVALATSADTGIYGIGYEDDKTEPTLLTQLKSNGLITRQSYGVFVNDRSAASGSIVFGGVDLKKFSGTLNMLSTTVSGGFLMGYTDGITYNKRTVVPAKTPVLFDTGATFIVLPKDYALPGLLVEGEFYLAPCKSRESISFSFGNMALNIPLKDIQRSTVTKTENGVSYCQFEVQQSPAQGPVVLGITFLQHVYLYQDIENKQIGLAAAATGITDAASSPIQSTNFAIPGSTTLVGRGTAGSIISSLKLSGSSKKLTPSNK